MEEDIPRKSGTSYFVSVAFQNHYPHQNENNSNSIHFA